MDKRAIEIVIGRFKRVTDSLTFPGKSIWSHVENPPVIDYTFSVYDPTIRHTIINVLNVRFVDYVKGVTIRKGSANPLSKYIDAEDPERFAIELRSFLQEFESHLIRDWKAIKKEDRAPICCSPAFDDPITFERMREPVIAPDGYTYDRSTVRRLTDGNGIFTSPMTRMKFPQAQIVPNRALAYAIETLDCMLLPETFRAPYRLTRAINTR